MVVTPATLQLGGVSVRRDPTSELPATETALSASTVPSMVNCMLVQSPGEPSALPLVSSAVTRHCQSPVVSALGSAHAVLAVVTVSKTVPEPAWRSSNLYFAAFVEGSHVNNVSLGASWVPLFGEVRVGESPVTRNSCNGVHAPLRPSASERRSRQVYGVLLAGSRLDGA